MSDPSLAVQKAVVTRLKAVAGVTALIGQRVFDHTPQGSAFPYVQIGNFQTVDDSADCIDGAEIFIELNVWSRFKGGQSEAKQIASAVRAALHEWAPTLDEPFAPVGNIEHRDTNYSGDGDGVTTRAILNFRLMVEST